MKCIIPLIFIVIVLTITICGVNALEDDYVNRNNIIVKLLNHTYFCEEDCYSKFNVCFETLDYDITDLNINFKTDIKLLQDYKNILLEKPIIDIVLNKDCYDVTINGKKRPFENVDNVPCFGNVCFEEFAWWNSSWYSNNIIWINNTDDNRNAINSTICIPLLGSECFNEPNSTRVVFNYTEILPFEWNNQSKTIACFVANESIINFGSQSSDYRLFCNNSLANDISNIMWEIKNDLENLSSFWSDPYGWGLCERNVIQSFSGSWSINSTADGQCTFINDTDLNRGNGTFQLMFKDNVLDVSVTGAPMQSRNSTSSTLAGLDVHTVTTVGNLTLHSNPPETWTTCKVLRTNDWIPIKVKTNATHSEVFADGVSCGSTTKHKSIDNDRLMLYFAGLTGGYIDDIFFGSDNINYELYSNLTIGLGVTEFSEDNTSILSNSFDVADFGFSSTEYVTGISQFFNTTKSVNLTVLTSMDFEKITALGSSEVFMRLNVDGVVIQDESVINVARDQYLVGGLRFSTFNVTSGAHNITIDFKRTGLGTIQVSNIDMIFIKFESNEENTIGLGLNTSIYNFSTTSFSREFNMTITKSVTSETFYALKQTLISNTTSKVDFTYENIISGVKSPYWERYLEDSADVGSVGMSFIEGTESVTHSHSILSKTDSGLVQITNQSILFFDLRDSESNLINNFHVSDSDTNLTNTKNYNSGLSNILNSTVIIRNGDSYFLSYAISYKSNTGEQTPTFIINSSNESINCESVKRRTLSNGDIGNVYGFVLCEPLGLGISYNFNFWVLVESGEVMNVTDETFSGFETTLLDISKGALPPLPNSIINPLEDSEVYGSTENISWLEFDDPNGDLVTYNISLFDLNFTYVETIQDGVTDLNINVDWDSITNTLYFINVEGCDDGSLCSNSSLNVSVISAPITLPPLNSTNVTCIDDYTLSVFRQYRNCTNDGLTSSCNTNSNQELILCPHGCIDNRTKFGADCYEPNYIWIIIFAILIVFVFAVLIKATR